MQPAGAPACRLPKHRAPSLLLRAPLGPPPRTLAPSCRFPPSPPFSQTTFERRAGSQHAPDRSPPPPRDSGTCPPSRWRQRWEQAPPAPPRFPQRRTGGHALVPHPTLLLSPAPATSEFRSAYLYPTSRGFIGGPSPTVPGVIPSENGTLEGSLI
ncbi:hypothetical protein RRG08_006978 [Elysia crispata]|uniref:Uncharacterized protein n=1 Tax=Elysia crispata TaxID=231223 RepID=A0AAE0ZU06_9GAST|nr:hypothetical protein RRG08_006978 [Elysia crispata]